jgi:hypothetical protein
MDARQQKHRNKHNRSEQEGKIHHLRHDIGEQIVFGHERFLDLYPKIYLLAFIWDCRIAFTRTRSRYIFAWGKSTRPLGRGAAFAIVVTRASSSPERRSL